MESLAVLKYLKNFNLILFENNLRPMYLDSPKCVEEFLFNIIRRHLAGLKCVQEFLFFFIQLRLSSLVSLIISRSIELTVELGHTVSVLT